MSKAGPPVPQPVGAYLRVGGRPAALLHIESVVREVYSSESELWLEICLPPLEGAGRGSLVVEFDARTNRGDGYLRNGYQSWSYAGPARAGDAIDRPGIDMAVMSNFSHLEPPVDTSVLAESEGLILFDGLVACALDGRRAPACFFATEEKLLLSFDVSGMPATSGGESVLDVVALVAVGRDHHRGALDRLVSSSALLKGARASAPLYTGWCSWYQYFSNVSEKEFLKNLAVVEKELPSLDVFQLDDGFQRAIGDWMETNAKFPSGIDGIARRVAEAGFTPGIWIAPFLATTESSIYSEHPEWFLKLQNGSPVPAMFNPTWGGDGFAYALDCTHPQVRSWLEDLGASLREAGFRYVKIDFCYAASMHGRSAVPAGRAERLVLGVSALSRGLGEGVFLLGCGIPLWPSVGIVDGMRIGPDVAPTIEPQQRIHGLTDSFPALANAWRNTVARAFMNRRLWINDPDCVMLRKVDTGLDATVAEAWGKFVASLGQTFLISDDLTLYGAREFDLARELAGIVKERDLPPGAPSPGPDPFDPAAYPAPSSTEYFGLRGNL